MPNMKPIPDKPTISQEYVSNSPVGSTDAFPPLRNLSNHELTLDTALEAFLRALEGKNRAAATRRAYDTDVSQFISWLHENNLVAKSPADVTKVDVNEYLSFLGQRQITGLSRARKLAAIREYCPAPHARQSRSG